VNLSYILTAEYITSDAVGRPILAGLFDRILLRPETGMTALVGLLARVEGLEAGSPFTGRWILSGPSPTDQGEVRINGVATGSPAMGATYLIAGVVLHSTKAGTLHIELELNGRVLGTRDIPVTIQLPEGETR